MIKESDKQIIGESIIKNLAKYVTEMGSGSHPNREYIKFMIPHDELFLGCLYPLKEAETSSEINEEITLEDSTGKEEIKKDVSDVLSTLRKPSSISINFGSQSEGKINITPSVSIYCRVIPTDEDYKEFIEKNNRVDEEKNQDLQKFIDGMDSNFQLNDQPWVWKRVDITLSEAEFDLRELNKTKKITKEYSKEDFSAIFKLDNLFIEPTCPIDINLFKTGGVGSRKGYWDQNKGEPIIKKKSLDWKVSLSIKDGGQIPGLESKNIHLLIISLTNITNISMDDYIKIKNDFEPNLFNCKLHCKLYAVNLEKIENSWEYELPYSKKVTEGKPPKSFQVRYPIEVWGSGCFPIYDRSRNEISTNITLIQNMPRDRPIDVSNIDALKFSKLSSDKVLDYIEEVYNYLIDYKIKYEKMISKKKSPKSILDKKQFDVIIKRFEDGKKLLEDKTNRAVLEAFKLMNETYKNAYGTGRNDEGWRLFQLVFIIGNLKRVLLPDSISDDSEDAELLFVATGGGKTETYVGLTICTLFYQRMKGHKYGIATWVKFPLRLLALDQFDRLTNIIIWAEWVRKQHHIDGDPFSLGFFVGNDPNYPATVAEWVYYRMGNPAITRIFKRLEGKGFNEGGLIPECPICKKLGNTSEITINGETVKIAGDYQWQYINEEHRVRHWCAKCNNEFHLFITDEEIFRYLPSILVSTVDKLVTGAWNPFFAAVLGASLYHCEKHGFSITPRNCSIMDDRCGNKSSEIFGDPRNSSNWAKLGRPFAKNKPFNAFSCKNSLKKIDGHSHAPVLIIQDELHLIKENLGTIDSYFETLIDTIIEKNTGHHPKYVAMSATLAGTRKQAGLLYLRGTTLWPGDAPSEDPLSRPLEDAFYEHLDTTHRVFVGMMPHGRTPDFAAYRSLQYCWMRIQEILHDMSIIKNSENSTVLRSYEDNEIKEFITDYYKKNFVYQGRKISTHNFAYALDRLVNKDLMEISSSYETIVCDAVTGDNSMEEIRNFRRRMGKDGDLHSLISTSLISHGVDIEYVNQMFFQGIPDLTAEFIQASSRIGRLYPGIVFVSFYPSRSRDLQLSMSFSMYLQTVKYWVEPVPIARWCKEALKEIFSTAVCFGLCCYGQQLLGSEDRIESSWPMTIHELGNPQKRMPGFLTWRIKREDLDGRLKTLLKEGLGIVPSKFILDQTPPDLLPIKVLKELEQQFESLYDRFTIELNTKVQGYIPDSYAGKQLAYVLKSVLGSSKTETGNKNAEFIEEWFNCMTGLRGIQEPVKIEPSIYSKSYLYGGGG